MNQSLVAVCLSVPNRTECEDECTGRHSNAQGIWDRDGEGTLLCDND